MARNQRVKQAADLQWYLLAETGKDNLEWTGLMKLANWAEIIETTKTRKLPNLVP